ncbi:MAG: hypothetical protein NWR64_06100 [Haliea sp.]|jgi:Mn2+/Fe2+ NRAMP family transporter|nr:hypothetical protein [Haliea sp.]
MPSSNNTFQSSDGSHQRITSLIRSMGPGIMAASAAVGGSHLVASTKAGALYGWQLAALILLVNVFKYPFFRAGVHYTVGTGQSLVEGYSQLGKQYLWAFATLAVVSAVINTAALTLFSASLLGYFLPFELTNITLSIIVIALCMGLLIGGKYRVLDSLSKFIMLALTLTTVVAAVIAFNKPAEQLADFVASSPWTLAAIGFIVITMGWMPAPIEISALNSMWLKKQSSLQPVTARSALFDFNVGYVTTALLALVFLSLGALMLFGTGTQLAESGMGFSHQLVNLYAANIGDWSRYLIAVIAFLCIFGSTITVIDGYARVIAESQRLISSNTEPNSERAAVMWIALLCTLGLAILHYYSAALIPMLNFAMVMAFMTTPFFALLNYVLLIRTPLPKELAPSAGLKWLSRIGLVYLFGFLGLFLWWRWIL